MIVVENCGGMDLAATLDCGQAFRWQAGPHGWQGIVENRAVTARMEGDTLILEGASETDRDFWVHYFALDMDYPALLAKFSSGNKRLAECVRHKPGIRVLRQPFFETLCTFIISQNNNIKRIRGIVETLCNTWGEPLPGGRSSFPGPEVLASLTEEDLQPLRSGFRAKYILDAARKTASGEVDLDHVASLPTEEAAAELCRIRGVGIKVAHCALLYGFHRIECLPVDVWMKRVMSTMYPQGLPEELLPYAGIAQQYLFHYSRSHPELFEA